MRLIENPKVIGIYQPEGVEVGDIWREPLMDKDDREAYGILLPSRTVWYTTQWAGDPPTYWDVSGEPETLTVHPSINDMGRNHPWHGWIRNGEFIDA